MSDMAREGLFASLGAAVEGARVLDLFAGTGAVGIEALSRGADSGVFVERNPKAVAMIRDNLARTKLGERGRVERAAVEAWLSRTALPQQGFDLVTLDPPYEVDAPSIQRLFEAVGRGWLARQGWTVVLTRGHNSPQPAVPVHWAVRRQLRYGDSLLTLYREERWA
jgi:16S rRNA (guanine966-N2)-methyltransferase